MPIPKGVSAPLGEASFRRFFIGQTTSTLGGAMSPLAATFAVLEHGNATDVGIVVGAGTVPVVLFLLVGGVVADRLGRRPVMVGADIVRCVAQAALAAWVILGSDAGSRVPLWGFIVLSATAGLGTGLFYPALTGLVPEVVSGANLQGANALQGLAGSMATLAGPALAGIIIAVANPGWAIAADAASYLVSVVTLWNLGARQAPAGGGVSLVEQLREGWSEFWSRTWLWVVVVQFSILNAVIVPTFLILGAVVAKSSLGGAGVWGAVLACQGAGSIVGGVVLLRASPSRPLLVCEVSALAFAFPLVALALTWPVAVIAVGEFFAGFALATFDTLWQTTMQRGIPDRVLSRVSAYDFLGSTALLPIGDALVGPVAHTVGDRTTFVAAAVIGVVGVLIVLAVPAVTGYRQPPGP